MKAFHRILVLALALCSCKDDRQSKSFIVSEEKGIDTIAGECPWLTRDPDGNIVLSWVRILNDSTTALCYATSKDGSSFSAPSVIPHTSNIQPHGENLPKVIYKSSGEMIALWGEANANPRNKYSGLVYYTRSPDGGQTWTTVQPLVPDTAGYDQRYYDVDRLPNGEVGILWLDNRKSTSREGSALYFAQTTKGQGFSSESRISEDCCQCCRTDLYIDSGGNLHAIYRGILRDSIRDMVHIVSTDKGRSFSRPVRISEDNWVLKGCPHTGPSMTANPAGLHFAWYTGGSKKGCFYTRSTDNGKSFAGESRISKLGSHPQIITLPGNDLMIAWDELSSEGKTVQRRIGIEHRDAGGAKKALSYLTPKEGNDSYPVLAASPDGKVIVAYTRKQDERNVIRYRLVQLKNP